MPVLYDRKGNPHNIPDEQVAEALASGQYAFPKGQDVIMRGEGGELYDVPPEGAAEMYRRGYRVEFEKEREERELQEEYGGVGGQLATFAHGAGKALSFGLLDEIGKGIGGRDYVQTVKKLKEANPDTHLGGELTGIFGSLFLPGGQAKAAAGLGKLGAGVRSVAKLGKKVEDVTAAALGGAKGGLIRQALVKSASLGAGAGLEGAAYGAGEFISEQALGDIEATAENLLAEMKMGAMWGGMAGIGLGGGGELIKRGLGAGANFSRRSARSIRKMYEKARGIKAVDGFEEAIQKELDEPGIWTKTVATYEGNDPKAVMELAGKSAKAKADRLTATSGPKVRQEAAYKMAEIRDAKGALQDEVRQHAMGQLKDEFFESAVGGDLVAQKKAILETCDNWRARLADMKANPQRYGFQTEIARMEKVVDDVEKAVNKVSADNPKAGGIIFNEGDRLKQLAYNSRKKMDRVRMPNDLHYSTMDEYASMAVDDLLVKLEDEALWGKLGAEAQREVNKIWAPYLQRKTFRAKYRLDRQAGERDFGKVSAMRGKKIFKADPGEHRRLIDDLGMEKSKLDIENLRMNVADEQRLVETIQKYYRLDEGMAARVKEAGKLSDEYIKVLDDMERVVGLQNQLADITANANKMGGMLGMGGYGAVGWIAGGPLGALAGVALSAFTSSGRRIHLQAALERMSSSIDLSIAKSIKGYIKKATGKLKPTARGMLAPASMKILQSSNWGEKRTKDKTRLEAFRRRSDELTEFLSNPQKTMDRIKRNTGDVSEVAPNVATAMMVKSVQAARYLYDRMPKPMTRGSLVPSKFKPSDLDLAKFERIAAVIDNPQAALDSLKAGMLTPEEVDALRANYPKIYERIVMTLAEQIPELREKLPYKERVQLSILFDVPVDETMEPEFLMAMGTIGILPPPMPPQGEKQPKSKLGSYSKLSVDNASLTDTQRVEMNKLS